MQWQIRSFLTTRPGAVVPVNEIPLRSLWSRETKCQKGRSPSPRKPPYSARTGLQFGFRGAAAMLVKERSWMQAHFLANGALGQQLGLSSAWNKLRGWLQGANCRNVREGDLSTLTSLHQEQRMKYRCVTETTDTSHKSVDQKQESDVSSEHPHQNCKKRCRDR